MTKIIDKTTGTTIFEICGNVTLDEAIELFGEYSNDKAVDGVEDTCFNGNWYFYDDLEAI